jgi:hypothetical protein
MDFITQPLTVGIIFYFVYMTFELFARRKERLLLIEKIGQNISTMDQSLLGNQFHSLIPSIPKKSFTGLRIGCLFIGIGLGLLIGLFLNLFIRSCNYELSSWEINSFNSVAYGASVLLFGGLGLIISYHVENKYSKKDKEQE